MENPEYVLFHLINHLGVSVNIQNMCNHLENHPDYPSLLALSDILNEWEIKNVALELSSEGLETLAVPFIAYLNTNNGEFALVTFIDTISVKISNEWWNNKSISINEFKDIYSGIALVFEPELITQAKEFKKEKKEGEDQEKKAEAMPPKTLPAKVIFADIGASYGLSVKWHQYVGHDLFELILVEPNQVEAQKIRKIYPMATVIPYALGNKRESVTINITESQACSSILEPDMQVLGRFPIKKWFRVVDKVQTEVYRFDDILAEMNISRPNFLKIDVQGFEYHVLEGFGEALNDVLCIELESHLIPIYKNEKTLMDINTFLNNNGFYLRHLESVGSFEGEVIEFNAYFVKRDIKLTTKKQRDLVEFWENINQIPEAKRCLG